MTNREVSYYDNSNMFQVIADFPKQLEDAYNIGNQLPTPGNLETINKIIISGLGGSAIAGDLLKSLLWYEMRIPLFVNRNYKLPAFAGENTLTIISSYSGDTEEAISAYEHAKEKNCKIICLSSGGKLTYLANSNNDYLITIPKGFQPRCALGYSFIPLLILFFKLGLISNKSSDIIKTITLIKSRSTLYSNITETENNAIKIAKILFQKLPIIYSSSDLMDSVNLRWRAQISENAKMLAYGNFYPELNHNEIVGWHENSPILKHVVLISLTDPQDHYRIKKRNEITLNIISELSKTIIELDGDGDSILERIFDLIYLGDWVSFYLAIFNKVDPTPVEKINYLKIKLLET